MNKDNLITLSIKNGDYSVIAEVPFIIFDTKTETIVNALKTCLNSVVNNEVKVVEALPKLPQEQQVIAPKRDEFKVRDRLPNNVVDVKTLDIKQAVTENALVRCPKCGQAHCLAVHTYSKAYLMERDFDANEFNIIAEFDSLTGNGFIDVCCKPDTNRLDYFKDLQNASIITYEDFALNNNTEVFCPVCCESDTFLNWKDAYENPLNYFETEHLCDVCGGEVVTKMVKKQKVNKCEKCGHETPHKEV